MYINLVFLNVTLTSLSTSVKVKVLSIPLETRSPTTASDSSEFFRASYLVLKFYLFRVFILAYAQIASKLLANVMFGFVIMEK